MSKYVFSQVKLALILFSILFSLFSFSQKNLSSIIKKSDEIYDSQKAFSFLDSLNQKAKLNEKTKVLLYEKLAQRALEVSNYGKLTEVCVKGIDLAQKNKLDSAEAFFYKFIGFSQSYNQKLKESIVSFKKSAEIQGKLENFRGNKLQQYRRKFD